MMSPVLQQAFIGSLVADAVAMPVHWYYDVAALDRDYGVFDGYRAPKNPHPDSILWRSRYQPKSKTADILHDQAQYWGQRGIHYHQFLQAGENTLNFQLAVELYRLIISAGAYDEEAWLEVYQRSMRTSGWHRDTYVEEYHRAFFQNIASGREPRMCGIDDVHIGGLAPVPALLAALDRIGLPDADECCRIVRDHVSLTHRNRHVLEAAEALTRILLHLAAGGSLRQALELHAGAWVKVEALETWQAFEDRAVVGRHLSPACYLPESFTASLYLVFNYAKDFSKGILANTRCGGDNCHRGTVVGALLGASQPIPRRWIDGLVCAPRLDLEETSENSN